METSCFTTPSVSGRHIESCILIWLDKFIEENDTYDEIFRKLRELVNKIERFTSPDECMLHILNIEDVRILLIISSTFGSDVISCFYQLTQINSIYILTQENGKGKNLEIEPMNKVKKVFLNIENIFEEIRRDIHQCEHNLIHFNIIGKTIQGHNNKQEASFMYAQLVKETILKTADGDEHEIAQFSRLQYMDNPRELTFIDELEQTYDQYSPVWWYTRQSFLYKILNKALRDQHIETLYAFRYFIRQLYEQLRYLHQNSLEKNPIILYRGQRMSNTQFNKLKANEGGLLSISNFLSTTSDKNVAMMFAGGDDETTAVLMIINIDLSMIGNASYANIDSISYFSGQEKEWLFSMGSVFRIGSLEKNNDNIWFVYLTLTNDQDPQLMTLTEHLRQTIQDNNPLYQLGRLMLEMDEIKRAEEFYQAAFEKMTEWRQRAAILHQLGTLADAQNQLDKALDYFQSSLRIYREHVSEDDPLLSWTYNNIGLIYQKQNQYDIALEYLHRALNIHLSSPQSNQENIARTYNNIATVLSYQENHEEALEYYHKTLDIKIKTLPSIHPSMAISYSNIAYSLYCLKRLTQAIEYQEKAVNIDIQSLPPGHTQTHQHQHLLAGYQLLQQVRNEHA